ncbi:hypothetical protein [Agrobacterium sp. CG674]
MEDIFKIIDDALANKVELFQQDDLWTVRVTEHGVVTALSFPEMDRAVDCAEAERERLGLAQITFL